MYRRERGKEGKREREKERKKERREDDWRAIRKGLIENSRRLTDSGPIRKFGMLQLVLLQLGTFPADVLLKLQDHVGYEAIEF